MMRFTVDARAFSDAMSKVSKVLRKKPASHSGGDRGLHSEWAVYADSDRP